MKLMLSDTLKVVFQRISPSKIGLPHHKTFEPAWDISILFFLAFVMYCNGVCLYPVLLVHNASWLGHCYFTLPSNLFLRALPANLPRSNSLFFLSSHLSFGPPLSLVTSTASFIARRVIWHFFLLMTYSNKQKRILHSLRLIAATPKSFPIVSFVMMFNCLNTTSVFMFPLRSDVFHIP